MVGGGTEYLPGTTIVQSPVKPGFVLLYFNNARGAADAAPLAF